MLIVIEIINIVFHLFGLKFNQKMGWNTGFVQLPKQDRHYMFLQSNIVGELKDNEYQRNNSSRHKRCTSC